MGQVRPVARSGSDAWAARPPRAPARRRPDRLARLRTVAAEAAGRYGSPQIPAVLPRAGDRIPGQTRARLMRPAGLRARVTRRDQTTPASGHGWPVADNGRARPCTATQPPATGRADIPGVAPDEGGRYLARLEDRATRPIVGGAVDARLTPDLVMTTLDRAVARHRPPAGVLHPADRGSPYAAAAYPARLARYGMTPSRSRQGHGGDTACIASWHRLLTKAWGYLTHFRTRAEARAARFAYIAGCYPRQRLHSARGYRTPQEAAAVALTASAMCSPFQLSTILT